MKVIGNSETGAAKANRAPLKRPRSHAERAFTLLEVMIALAIVGVALVALLSLNTRSIQVHSRLQKITQATLLAQEKMSETEVLAETKNLDFSAGNGSYAPPFNEYRWQLAFGDTPIASVKMVTVKVLWGEEEKNELVELNSFLF
jgi:general secretion pathway protein I